MNDSPNPLTLEPSTSSLALAPPPRTIRIDLHSACRDAALLSADTCPEGHRGVWFYDQALIGSVSAGDAVEFRLHGEILERGRVTEAGLRAADHPGLCSFINSAGFRWE